MVEISKDQNKITLKAPELRFVERRDGVASCDACYINNSSLLSCTGVPCTSRERDDSKDGYFVEVVE